ncbi:PREDICTED: AF4/FMR2 family member 1 isoform X1 [Gavialis gangeticus]|uniref:AF4/FMR2 family member 1 isoform X1 n=2 Tax=Gavialis gangeticus TaxID=94835 RepID=UPI00092F60C7|nr:PREDICTED: AF4/FMR2 family member 1 isoform X1 [Gavialis gangeticus]XP_019381540.1 PREDICTED: AF4/FMR2 family member 1 isoform X1 [Gavialis gangeticus]
MASTDTQHTASSSNGLYNEDRNLLRIRERERRNQEALQERDTFPENIPLFAEPYKTNKEDELSSRIQNMLGNYEEVKELINNRSHQNLIGIPKSVVSLIPQGKPDRPSFLEKTSNTLPPSFQHRTHHQPMGPLVWAPSPASNSIHYQKTQLRTEPASSLHTKSHSLSNSRSQGQEYSRSGQERHNGTHHKKNERRVDEGTTNELQASLLELSPLLSSLSSPVAPLSPLHSSQHVNSRSQNSKKSHGQPCSQMQSTQDLMAGSHDSENWDGLAINLAGAAQPSSQTFPPSLPSKTSVIQQKPTAYVRPMDGQDQAPYESPELKALPEEYHGEPYEKISDLKANAKARLSKLKIPSEPIEQTFPNDVHCVEEILKEMTHSWPPPLTAIHTPSTAEPSKFPFPTKESQHAGSVIQSQKQYDASSKTLPSSQQGTSMLQNDLQLSDTEDSDDDHVTEKPPPSSAPPSAPQSQPESVASAHSSSAESGSTSDSDSSSDSDSESSSSDSEANEPPRTLVPEPEPPTSNKWQLDNWLTKVNPPTAATENLSEVVHSHSHLESKGQGKGSSRSSSSSNSSAHERSGSKELHPKNSSKAARAPLEGHLPTKRNCQKSPTHAEEPSQRQTVGTKKPSKIPLQEEPKGGLKVESEPGPYEVKDQSSRDKPKVKTKGRPKSSDKKDSKTTVQESSEKKKHKKRQAASKPFLDPKPVKDTLTGNAPEHFPLSPLAQSQSTTHTRTSGDKSTVVVREDFHRNKFLLPIRDKKLSPLRDFITPHALVVKIELALLTRVPQPPGKGNHQKKLEGKALSSARKRDLEKKSTETPNKPLKRKGNVEKETGRKKIKLEKETKSLQASRDKDSSKMKVSKCSYEVQKRDFLLLPPLPPVSPAQKPAKMAQKRHNNESSACCQLPATINSTAKSKSNYKDPSSSKHRKVEEKHYEYSKSNKGSARDTTNPFSVPSLPNGTSKPRRPQVKIEKPHPMEYHIEEAKRLKHKADAMTDKVGKAFQYLDAALSFIEYGIAMESDALTPKSAYTIFTETIDLVKFIMTLKSFTDSSASAHEKIFAVLCMRCQSILHMAMFRYKKDTAIKYSRILNDHFKSSSRITQAPSPCVARSTGTPSPLSPMPSPASSVSSQPGSNASNSGSSGIGSSISVPHNIPSITSSYVNITSYILYAYDIWEQADALARKNKEFFAELSTAVCSLALNGSMTELVHYTRQGLQWLRLETNTP